MDHDLIITDEERDATGDTIVRDDLDLMATTKFRKFAKAEPTKSGDVGSDDDVK